MTGGYGFRRRRARAATVAGTYATYFIEISSPEPPLRAGEKLLRYLSQVAVNGPDPSLGASGPPPTLTTPTLPKLPLPRTPAPARAADDVKVGSRPSLRDTFVKHGACASCVWDGVKEGRMGLDFLP